jgi:hypothetical protein
VSGQRSDACTAKAHIFDNPIIFIDRDPFLIDDMTSLRPEMSFKRCVAAIEQICLTTEFGVIIVICIYKRLGNRTTDNPQRIIARSPRKVAHDEKNGQFRLHDFNRAAVAFNSRN